MILGNIVEKPSSSSSAPAPPRPPSLNSQAFPPVLHRSQRPGSRFSTGPPKLGESSKAPPTNNATTSRPVYENLSEEERLRQSVDDENERRVAGMDSETRDEEVRELKERFGPGLEDLMRKRRQKRLDHEQMGQPPPNISTQDPQSFGRGDGGLEAGGSSDNAARVEAMSQEERDQEVAELEERFGSTVIDALRRRAEAKAQSSSASSTAASAAGPGKSSKSRCVGISDISQLPQDDRSTS